MIVFVALFLCFLDDVVKTVLVAVIVMILAYRLLTWPAAAAAAPQVADAGGSRPPSRETAVQVKTLDEVFRGLFGLADDRSA